VIPFVSGLSALSTGLTRRGQAGAPQIVRRDALDPKGGDQEQRVRFVAVAREMSISACAGSFSHTR